MKVWQLVRVEFGSDGDTVGEIMHIVWYTPVDELHSVGTVYLVAGVVYILESFNTFLPFGYYSVLSRISSLNHSLIISSETIAFRRGKSGQYGQAS